ncbi:unnamed protein product [Danaus chrysippus]|uniref:(African queen) hypothetical protein n=1 Tax=Danaus chrysippus TaxID=151541 RepID=A0A8J2VUX8_9NEOP|nr:unnamed protein product [Danaus chrysippus]
MVARPRVRQPCSVTPAPLPTLSSGLKAAAACPRSDALHLVHLSYQLYLGHLPGMCFSSKGTISEPPQGRCGINEKLIRDPLILLHTYNGRDATRTQLLLRASETVPERHVHV